MFLSLSDFTMLQREHVTTLPPTVRICFVFVEKGGWLRPMYIIMLDILLCFLIFGSHQDVLRTYISVLRGPCVVQGSNLHGTQVRQMPYLLYCLSSPTFGIWKAQSNEEFKTSFMQKSRIIEQYILLFFILFSFELMFLLLCSFELNRGNFPPLTYFEMMDLIWAWWMFLF